MEKHPPADIKDKKLDLAVELDLVSREAKCLCKEEYPKEVLRIFFKKEYAIINVKDLNIFEEGTTVTPELLIENGLIKKVLDGVKVLGDGELEKKLRIQAHKVSKQAEEKITALGGEIEVI